MSMDLSDATSRPCRKRPLSPSVICGDGTHTTEVSAFQQALRSIQTGENLSPRTKADKIHALYAERRRIFLKQSAKENCSSFPGKGAKRGCEHYQRGCWLRAKCCGRFYACRRCHDENEDHEIDRHATEEVGCVKCGEVQEVRKDCRNCGAVFAKYFCEVCRFYDDTEGKEAYHCHGCGICRVGKGLGIDYHHCERCETCVPIQNKDTHPCRVQSLDVNCPICREYLKTSTSPVVFMRCGHVMHKGCFGEHIKKAYTCPLCKKSLTDMTEYFSNLDKKIAKETIPPEFVNRRSNVLCRDCDQKSIVPFHFVHHKCGQCGSYNTQLLNYIEASSNSTLERPLTDSLHVAQVTNTGSTVQVEETT